MITKILLIYILVIATSGISTVFSAETAESTNSSDVNNERALISDIYDSLYSAIEMDRANEVKQFIAFGADIDHRYKGEKTPLMLASSMGSISVVKVLLELGANQYLKSEENMNAIDYAQVNNNKFVVAVLQTDNQLISKNNDSATEKIEVVEAVASDINGNTTQNTENPKVALLNTTNSTVANTAFKEKGGYPDIAGTYNAKTIAVFSECGSYNQTIQYYADETIKAVSKNGKFKLSYTSPLLTCKGLGNFLKDRKKLQGKYNCSYKTEQGFQGTLHMKINGIVEDDKIYLNYKGHDTSPSFTCSYSWERVITLNK